MATARKGKAKKSDRDQLRDSLLDLLKPLVGKGNPAVAGLYDSLLASKEAQALTEAKEEE